MPKVVEIPGVGNVEFPDSMSDDQISQHAKQAHDDAQPSAVSRFLSNAVAEANPVGILRGMGNSILHPIQAIKGYLAQNQDLADKAEAAWKRGDHGQALKHFGDLALQVIPGLGAKSDEAGRQIAQGDVAGGLGKSTGTALGVVEAAALPKVMRGTAEAIHAAPGVVAEAGTALADAATSPLLTKALERSGDAAVVGGIVHGSPSVVAGGVASRLAGGMLKKWGERRAMTPKEAFEAARETPAEVPPAPSPTLDEIAQGQAGKRFDRLSPEQQAGVQRIHDQIHQPQPVGPAQQPSPVQPSPVAGQPVAGAPGSNGMPGNPVPDAVPPQGSPAAVPSNGTATVAREMPPPEATTKPITPGERAFRQARGETREKAGEGGSPTAKPTATEAAEALRDAIQPKPVKGGIARAMADELVKRNLSPDEAKGMPLDDWASLAKDVGVKAPNAAGRREVLFNLKRKLAGPERTPAELFEAVRKGTK